jgi:hypothetical protein
LKGHPFAEDHADGPPPGPESALASPDPPLAPVGRLSAEVEVRSVFAVKGRGAVAIAYPCQGTVRVGQQARPSGPVEARPATRALDLLTLAAAEVVRSPDGGADAIGLVFHERPSLEDLRATLPPGTRLRFEDATGPGAAGAAECPR